jgi:tetratricopeptide (TPR) repeat protein
MPLEFSPGEQFAYSNSGYFLLGVIIEKVTGKTYEQVLRESILEPLQMTNTGYDHHDVVLENRAAGYAKNGNEYVNAPYLDMSLPYAAGSMYSTVEDLYLWDQALYTNQLASEKAMDLIFTGHVAAGPTQYGYGWGISQTTIGGSGDPKTIIGHGGGIPGFNTNISRVPADKHLIVLFNNTGGAALNDMTAAIRNILYDQPYDMPKMSLATSLSNIILKKGIDKGLVFYEKYKDSENYSLKENEMNNAGYQFLQTGKVKEAIAVFQLNVEAFPSSGNVYDSLGEAYLEDGNKELAIKNYQKSIEIDPGNTNGIDMLKKIQSN